jgi:hypothetical protein
VDPHISAIQTNAILSWTLLTPKPEIWLLGDEQGVDNIASDLSLHHYPRIRTTSEGTPLVNDILEKSQHLTTSPVVLYVNSDIIFPDNSIGAVLEKLVPTSTFLLSGARIDLEIQDVLRLDEAERRHLKARARAEGELMPFGVDYMAFSVGLFRDVPPFALGRPGYDNWMLWEARRRNAHLIDATRAVIAIHQNHRPPGEWAKISSSEEAIANIRLAGKWRTSFTLGDASHYVEDGKLKRRSAAAVRHRTRVLFSLLLSPGRGVLSAAKRRILGNSRTL